MSQNLVIEWSKQPTKFWSNDEKKQQKRTQILSAD